VFGQIGVLIALVALTIVLAGVFLVRPSITLGSHGQDSRLCRPVRSSDAMHWQPACPFTCSVPNRRHTAFRATAWKATDRVCTC
jgi:hypothetical protein